MKLQTMSVKRQRLVFEGSLIGTRGQGRCTRWGIEGLFTGFAPRTQACLQVCRPARTRTRTQAGAGPGESGMLRLAGIAELMLLAVSAAADALVFAEQAGGNRNLAERPAAMRKADIQVSFAAQSSHARLNFVVCCCCT